MFWLWFIFLGILQGITEFLPISSTSHLTVLSNLLGESQRNMPLEVGLHVGTLGAVLIYYRQPILSMVKDTLTFLWQTISFKSIKNYTFFVHQSFLIVIATIPVVIVGFLVKKYIGTSFALIGINSILFGYLLYYSDHFSKGNVSIQELTFKKVFILGLWQSLAVIPGVSRSGACITGLQFFHLNRIEAVNFSFLLSIPVVLGSAILVGFDVIHHHLPLKEIIVSAFVAMSVGLITIHTLLNYLKNHSFKIFSLYRIFFGIIVLFFWFFNFFK